MSVGGRCGYPGHTRASPGHRFTRFENEYHPVERFAQARSARTTKETVAAVGQRLAEDGTRVLGTVLNEWDPRKASHAGYGYGYQTYSRPAGD